MNLPRGFLGTNADILIDSLIVGQLLLPPFLIWSIRLARAGELARHARIQKRISLAMGAIILVFEIYLRLLGGFSALFKGSAYAESTLLYATLSIHIAFAVGTVVLWVIVLWTARKHFGHPPVAGNFSPRHKRLACLTTIQPCTCSSRVVSYRPCDASISR